MEQKTGTGYPAVSGADQGQQMSSVPVHSLDGTKLEN